MTVELNKESELFIRKNQVVLSDNFFSIGQTEEKDFYSIEVEKSDFSFRDPYDLNYANVVIKIEAREDTYERTALSIFDFTGLLGGVYEILEISGGILVGFFADRLFMFWIISNLYQVQTKYDDDNELDKNDQNLKRYGFIKRRVRDNKMKNEETKFHAGKIFS